MIRISPPRIELSSSCDLEVTEKTISTPSSPFITEHAWRINGVQESDNRSFSHTFEIGETYTINLTSTLDNGQTVTSSRILTMEESFISIHNSMIFWDQSWCSGGAYIVHQDLEIPSGLTLTIEPGTTVRMKPGTRLTIYGTLIADGVTFTSDSDTTPWDGIYFVNTASSASRLTDCTIENTSYASSSNAMEAIVIRNSSPTITGCIIRKGTIGTSEVGIWIEDSDSEITGNTVSGFDYGIYIKSGSPKIYKSVITDNQNGIYYQGNGSPTIAYNKITNNTSYGIRVSSGDNTLSAENNYWGDQSGPLDNSDDTSSGGLYNPDGLGDTVTNYVDYYPWADSIDIVETCGINLGTTVKILQLLTGAGNDLSVDPCMDFSGDGKIGMDDLLHHLNQAVTQ